MLLELGLWVIGKKILISLTGVNCHSSSFNLTGVLAKCSNCFLLYLNRAHYSNLHSSGRKPYLRCEALYEHRNDPPRRRARLRKVDGGWCQGKYNKVVGEEKGPLKALLQIKCERVKGDYEKMKLLKEGDEKNRGEMEDTLNLRRNHFFI